MNDSTMSDTPLEALAKFTINATALRRGDSRSQLRSADAIRFEMPRACPVESHAAACQPLTAATSQ